MADNELHDEQWRIRKRQLRTLEMKRLMNLIQENQRTSEQFLDRLTDLLELTNGKNGSQSNSMNALYQQLGSFEEKNQRTYRGLTEQLSTIIAQSEEKQKNMAKNDCNDRPASSTLYKEKEQQMSESKSISKNSESYSIVSENQTTSKESCSIQKESRSLPRESRTIASESRSLPKEIRSVVGGSGTFKRESRSFASESKTRR